MNKKVSTFIYIVANIFLISALLNISSAVMNSTLIILLPGKDSTLILSHLLSVIIGTRGTLYLFSGWHLFQRKRWAYILGYGLEIFSLALYVGIFIKMGNIGYLLQSLLSVILLILLILGRKDFKKI